MGNRLEFRDVPKRAKAPSKAPDEIDLYRAVEAAKRKHADTLRQARSRYDAELHYAPRSHDAHAVADAARAQLERDLQAADKALNEALAAARRKLYIAAPEPAEVRPEQAR
jgi:hypothetical protein